MAARFTTAALVSALAMAATAAIGAPACAAQLAPGDLAFAREAAWAGMEEEALGRAAEDRAAAPAVRDFASRMVDDHAQADARLRALAQREGFARGNGHVRRRA